MLRRELLLLTSLGLLASTPSAGPALVPGLGPAGRALGRLPPATRVEGAGKAKERGVEGSLRVLLAPDGRFRFEVESELPGVAGFDGTTAWTRDRSGLERTVVLEDADRSKLFAWVLSGHWCAAPELAIRELERASGEPPRLELALRGTPMTMTLALDEKTFLPSELDYQADSGLARWRFADFAAVSGLTLARRWEFDEGAGVDSFALDAWKAAPLDPAAFRATRSPPADTSFEAEIEPELEVVRVPSGHLLVEPWVEGESVGMFIFDTGAGAMTIDPKVADELGMPELGEVLAVGVGGKTTASFRRGTRFQLGPLALEDPVYIELDLAFLAPIFGRKVAGIVGYDVLARCVAEIETRTPYVALHDPARFQLAGASWQEVIVTENTPSVRARFEGDHEGLFRIDTGADGTLSFHAPAVRELALLDGRTVTSSASGGVGGTSEAKNGRLEWFELAGHRFEKKMVQFSLAEHGAFADRYTLGNIGQEFLAPFRMVLDYPGGRIAFVPLGK
jgi:predicted aspartyl protease